MGPTICLTLTLTLTLVNARERDGTSTKRILFMWQIVFTFVELYPSYFYTFQENENFIVKS